mmetsp:Transcript_29719/g.98491  ORF Transcript_29719/g.98491 Transcript_29719/m.98491 type:complete len:224 (+) Transcript_29719:936-1607(+)
MPRGQGVTPWHSDTKKAWTSRPLPSVMLRPPWDRKPSICANFFLRDMAAIACWSARSRSFRRRDRATSAAGAAAAAEADEEEVPPTAAAVSSAPPVWPVQAGPPQGAGQKQLQVDRLGNALATFDSVCACEAWNKPRTSWLVTAADVALAPADSKHKPPFEQGGLQDGGPEVRPLKKPCRASTPHGSRASPTARARTVQSWSSRIPALRIGRSHPRMGWGWAV